MRLYVWNNQSYTNFFDNDEKSKKDKKNVCKKNSFRFFFSLLFVSNALSFPLVIWLFLLQFKHKHTS